MPRNRVSDMDFDEISTVDIPANQHGLIVLAKSANSPEGDMDFYDEDGNLLEGQPVQDEDGNVFFQTSDGDVLDIDASELYDGEQERELEAVGKSAFLEQIDGVAGQVYGQMSEELTKALTEAGRDDVLAKAFAAQSQQLAALQAQAQEATEIAKAAHDREQERMFIAKAAEDYDGLGVDPGVLGPVLKRMSESMSYDDCAVVAGIFARQTDIFKSYGVPGGEAFDNPLAEIEAFANEHGTDLAKSYNGGEGRETLSKEQQVRAYFDQNPGAYSELKRGR